LYCNILINLTVLVLQWHDGPLHPEL
jgi:hypothetical protein